MKVYYAHHQFKYRTKIEDYEMDLIRSYYEENIELLNPSELIDQRMSETQIMKQCVNYVLDADNLIFSSMDGCIGIGVFTEVMTALAHHKPVYYLYQDHLIGDFEIIPNPFGTSNDRVFAIVDPKN